MTAQVVDSKVLRALQELKAWVDAIPKERLEGLSLPDLHLDWIDDVIRNNTNTTFAYENGDKIELLVSVSEDEFGYSFKSGMAGTFEYLLDGTHCVIEIDSALDDECGGMGEVEVICRLTDIKLVRA